MSATRLLVNEVISSRSAVVQKRESPASGHAVVRVRVRARVGVRGRVRARARARARARVRLG